MQSVQIQSFHGSILNICASKSIGFLDSKKINVPDGKLFLVSYLTLSVPIGIFVYAGQKTERLPADDMNKPPAGVTGGKL